MTERVEENLLDWMQRWCLTSAYQPTLLDGACGREPLGLIAALASSVMSQPAKVAASISERCMTADINFVYQPSDDSRESHSLAVCEQLCGGGSRDLCHPPTLCNLKKKIGKNPEKIGEYTRTPRKSEKTLKRSEKTPWARKKIKRFLSISLYNSWSFKRTRNN